MRKAALCALLLLLAALFLFPASPAKAADLQRIAAMPESEQLKAPVQGELQKWFLGKVQAYMDSVKSTEIGKSSLVSPGDLGRFRTILAAPTSKGSYSIVLRKGITRPVTLSGGFGANLIAFPASNPGGTFSTAWHESMHAMLNRLTLDFDPSPWAAAQLRSNPEAYNSEDTESRMHHVLIEQAAEKIFLWISSLGEFEKEMNKASEKMKDLKKRGLATAFNTYEVERQVWGNAHMRWQLLWKQYGEALTAGNRSPQVPKELREILAGATGVRAPFTEEIIGFYMKKDVPEWVFQPKDLTMPVLIREKPEKEAPKVTKDLCEAEFLFSVVEGRKKFPVIQSGRLAIWADVPQGEKVRMSLSLNGREAPFGRAKNGGYGLDVDLAQKKSEVLAGSPFPFKVKIQLKNPANSVNKRAVAIPIHVLFTDTSTGKGSKLYLPVEGIFVLKLKPDSKGSGSSGGGGSGGGGGGGGSASASGLGGDWLVKKNPDSKAPAFTGQSWSLMKMKGGEKSIQTMVYLSKFTSAFQEDVVWSGIREEGKPAKQNLGDETIITDDGESVNVRKGRNILTVDSGLYIGPGVSHSDIVKAGWEVAVHFARQMGGSAPKVEEQEAPEAVLVRQDKVKIEENPALDEVPPKVGEIQKVIEIRPPSAGRKSVEPAGNWYVHPTKSFRFRIPSSWKIVEKRDGKEIDRIMAGKGEPFLMIEVTRDEWSTGESGLLQKLEAKLKEGSPKARGMSVKLAGRSCRMVVEDLRGKHDVTLWQVLIPRGKGVFYLAVASDMTSDHGRLPKAAREVLDSLEFLKR